MGYIKEELGHIPGRIVISAYANNARVFCHSFSILDKDHGMELARTALAKAGGTKNG